MKDCGNTSQHHFASMTGGPSDRAETHMVASWGNVLDVAFFSSKEMRHDCCTFWMSYCCSTSDILSSGFIDSVFTVEFPHAH